MVQPTLKMQREQFHEQSHPVQTKLGMAPSTSKLQQMELYPIQEENQHEILQQSYGHKRDNPNGWAKQIHQNQMAVAMRDKQAMRNQQSQQNEAAIDYPRKAVISEVDL